MSSAAARPETLISDVLKRVASMGAGLDVAVFTALLK
jgi:hypothetical protein